MRHVWPLALMKFARGLVSNHGHGLDSPMTWRSVLAPVTSTVCHHTILALALLIARRFLADTAVYAAAARAGAR